MTIPATLTIDVAGLPVSTWAADATVAVVGNNIAISLGGGIDTAAIAVPVSSAAALIEQIANALHLAIAPVEGMAA